MFAKNHPNGDGMHTECPVQLLCGNDRTESRPIIGYVSVAFLAVLFAAILAGPAAYAIWPGKNSETSEITRVQGELCKQNLSACGDVTGSIIIN